MKFSQTLEKVEEGLRHAAILDGRDVRLVVRNIGWVSAGITVLAIGVVVGRELRERYKFHRRTPYDIYAHAGDHSSIEFGVGV